MESEGGSNPLISGRMAQGGRGQGEEGGELGILANRFVQTFPNKTKIYGLQRDLVNRRELDQILAARNELEAWLAKGSFYTIIILICEYA